jgi:hypothetical protein
MIQKSSQWHPQIDPASADQPPRKKLWRVEAASELGSERVSNGREHVSQMGNDRVSIRG